MTQNILHPTAYPLRRQTIQAVHTSVFGFKLLKGRAALLALELLVADRFLSQREGRKCSDYASFILLPQ